MLDDLGKPLLLLTVVQIDLVESTMSQKSDQPSRGSCIQVFEQTVDSPEDQDELNRRLRKPGEAESDASTKRR